MMKIEFFAPGRCIAKGRPQFNRSSGRARTPAKTRHWEEYVGLRARQAMALTVGDQALLEGPLGAQMTFIFRRPERVKTTHCLYAQSGRVLLAAGGSYPDLSNLVKAVEDGLQGIVYGDDCQICELSACKVYGARGEEPGVEVKVWTI